MMDLNALLKICVDKGIKLSLQDGNLKINAKKGLMTAELSNIFKHHKAALIEHLNLLSGNVSRSLPITHLHQKAPVSFAQKRFWMLHSISPESSAYHIPGSFALSGDLNISAFIEALQNVTNRHDILRTVYHEENGELLQSVVNDRSVTVDVIDLTYQDNSEILKEAINAHKTQVFTYPFDLSKDLPVRVRLICTPNQYFEVLLCVHHIAADAWSIPLFLQEFEMEYQSCCMQSFLNRSPRHQYIDFAVWQQERAKQGVYSQQLEYWQKQLTGIPNIHEMNTDFSRPQKSLGSIGVFDYQLPANMLDGLTALGVVHKATLFSVLHSLLALFVFRWSAQQHVVIGSPVTGRHLKELEPMLGCFINSIAINNTINHQHSFEDLLKQVNDTVQRAMQHQELPFEHLVESLDIDRVLGVNPVFQIMLALQSGGEQQESFYDLQLHSSASRHTEAKVDLTLNVTDNGNGLNISWQYAKTLFKEETIKSMADTFALLIKQVIAKPTTKVADFWLTEDHVIEHSYDSSLPCLLPAKYFDYLHQSYDQVVLIDQNVQWTGGQTLDFIRQVQGYCIQHKFKANDRVMLALDKSVQTYATIYALWGLGITYVPFSMVIPSERLKLMVDQIQPKAVIFAEEEGVYSIAEQALTVKVSDFMSMRTEHSLTATISPSDVAYILFTSGTTGVPKGVGVSHQQLACFIDSLNKLLPRAHLRLAVDFPLIFDASLASIGLMSQGHCLYAVPENIKATPTLLSDLLSQHEIDLLFLSTRLLEILMADKEFFNQSSVSFKFGGEACSQKLWDLVARYCIEHDQFALNAYGPTETTVAVSCPKVTPGEAHIGQPMQANTFRVYDQFDHICPVQMPGELEIQGPQVSLGYIDKTCRENRRFTMSDTYYSRYKTGDVVIKLENGDHQYIGRRDNQIKLNGYRIELADIEAIAQHTKSISQIAAKLVTHNEQEFLALFYVGKENEKAVKLLCGKHLPSYMLPHIIERCDALPTTANGKIDRKKLHISLHLDDVGYELPETDLWLGIVDIWKSNLPPSRLKKDSDFFSVGGHSLSAIKVIHEVNFKYRISVPVSILFECSILSSFVEAVNVAIDEQPSDELLKELEDMDESALHALLEEL